MVTVFCDDKREAKLMMGTSSKSTSIARRMAINMAQQAIVKRLSSSAERPKPGDVILMLTKISRAVSTFHWLHRQFVAARRCTDCLSREATIEIDDIREMSGRN